MKQVKSLKKHNSFALALRKDRPKLFRFSQITWTLSIHPAAYKWIALILLSIILTLVISYRLSARPSVDYRLGQIASVDVKAPEDFLVEDGPATLEKITKSVESVPSVYDFDLNVLSEIERKSVSAFAGMRNVLTGHSQEGDALGEPDADMLSQLLGFEVSESTFAELKKREFDPAVLTYIYPVLTPFYEQGVVSDRDLIDTEKERGIMVRYFPTRDETLVYDFTSILDLEQARSTVRKAVRSSIPSQDKALEKPVTELVQGFLRPNLTFNKSETEERKMAAGAAVKPVLFEIKKGEIVLREGERVTAEHLLRLDKIQQLKNGTDPLTYTWGNFAVVFLLIVLAFTAPFIEEAQKPLTWYKDLLFMGIMLALLCLMVQISVTILEGDLQFFSGNTLFYALPTAACAMVISVVLGVRHAAVFAVLGAAFFSMIAGFSLEHVIYPLVGSLIGAREAIYSRQRSTLFKAGLWVGVVNSILIFCFVLKEGLVLGWKPLLGDVVVGFSSGFVSGIIATGLVPLVEVLFSYTTDMKLLDLSNLNHPLMRELIVKAPGTYHHCIVVGSLVEAAAEAIGANPLLARVGAYYHDIGKMRKAPYFIENQRGIENKHDKLSPSMSSLILISHVKDGVERAKEYRLGKVITDIIQQHHGSSLITYFYQRAKEREKGNHSDTIIDEKDFRYPGPKPQTKEAGLVMLADAVEASARTLTDPTSARIQGMVQKIIMNSFSDGQLDACRITLNDLHLIAKSFNRILTGIFHHRIEYPERHEYLDQESAKEASRRYKNGQEDRDRDLKRLGIS